MSLKSLELQETTLPPDAPDFLVGSASRNRLVVPHSSSGKKYILPDTISSAQEAIAAQKLTNNTYLLISDASSPDDTLKRIYGEALRHINLPPQHARTFFITRNTRRTLVEPLIEKTGYDYEVVKATVDGAGYGDNRDTLDNVIAAWSKTTGKPIRFVTIDDDVALSATPLVWREDVLAKNGITPIPNSQVVYAFKNPGEKKDLLERRGTNDLRAFFAPLGKTVDELRRVHPGMKIAELVVDTRPEAFHLARTTGQMAQFIVSAEGPGLTNADKGTIIATTEDKSGLPDYPTWIISKGNLEDEYPIEEPVEAFPSGPKELYAGLRSDTIFPDSALFGRIFDASNNRDPAYWPWWHVSSLRASRKSGIVDSSNRSDNDYLPKWFKYILEQTGQLYLYASGIDTYALHTRTPFGGDRRMAHEVAIASQVGNIAAVETFQRFEFPPSGIIYMYPIERNYLAPAEHSQVVFDRMRLLAEICDRKTSELLQRLDRLTDQQQRAMTQRKIARYQEELRSLTEKMSGFDFPKWKERLDTLIREQLEFSRKHLAAKPVIISELSEFIRKGKYPVLEVVLA